MLLKVLSYNRRHDYHNCKVIPSGNVMKIDLLVSGDLREDTIPEDLIGKTVEVGWCHPYISIAGDVKILEE